MPETTASPQLFLPAGFSYSDTFAAAMIDYDINLNGTANRGLHWYQPDLVADRSSKQLKVANTSDTAAVYLGPAPPPGPSHRYTLLLFKQPSWYKWNTCLSNVTTREGRVGFNEPEFASVLHLGTPVAANWFQLQNPTPTTTPPPKITTTSSTTYPCQKTIAV
jgi:phosphatidylethanolamine-binding protein